MKIVPVILCGGLGKVRKPDTVTSRGGSITDRRVNKLLVK
jgi:hypothetical protein